MSRSQLQDSIERWLFHENYSFKESKTEEDVFRFIIKGLGAYKIPIEIFEPKKQSGGTHVPQRKIPSSYRDTCSTSSVI
jgi:hypothetical protein